MWTGNQTQGVFVRSPQKGRNVVTYGKQISSEMLGILTIDSSVSWKHSFYVMIEINDRHKIEGRSQNTRQIQKHYSITSSYQPWAMISEWPLSLFIFTTITNILLPQLWNNQTFPHFQQWTKGFAHFQQWTKWRQLNKCRIQLVNALCSVKVPKWLKSNNNFPAARIYSH